MKLPNILVRLARAISGQTQNEFGATTTIHPVQLAQYETGTIEPGVETLDLVMKGVGLTAEAGEEILRVADLLRQPRERVGQGEGDLYQEWAAGLLSGFYRRLLHLPTSPPPPSAQDRARAAESWLLLQDLTESQALGVAPLSRGLHNWALVERLGDESAVQASCDVERATFLARLAAILAERVPGEESWRRCVQGRAEAHVANVLRVAGRLLDAATHFEKAKHLADTGSDPYELLDPGRLLDLEASLRCAQSRFPEALDLLERAGRISRAPGRVLIKKAFTLECMGDYGQAVETLLAARSQLDVKADPRLRNILEVNLCLNFSHVGRFAEAADRLRRFRPTTAAHGDTIYLIRITWIEGRLAAGLGQTEEALRLLAEARRQFAARGMAYDVALALLEECVLLLAAGRTAEVRALARDLAQVFAAQDVHREALAALRLFQEAAEQEAATVELARQVLGYLFRARHDEGVAFGGTAD